METRFSCLQAVQMFTQLRVIKCLCFRFVRWMCPSSSKPMRWSTTCCRMSCWTRPRPSTSTSELRSWRGPIRACDSRTSTCSRSSRYTHTRTHACTKEEKLPLPVLCSIRSPLPRCSHPGVPRSSVQPGESSGGFGPGRGAAEGAGFCIGGGEEAAAEHHHTPPGPPLQPRDKRQPRRTGAAFTVRLTDSHSSIKAGGQRAAR